MNTYFIRHTSVLDIDLDTRDRLWRDMLIGIHYPENLAGSLPLVDNSSLDPRDYPATRRRAIKALVELAQNGGYVCAQHYGHEEVQIGFVPPGSKIELLEGKWGAKSENHGRRAILKTIRLQKVQIVRSSDYAVISTGRPRQGTIARWPNAGNQIRNLVERLTQPISLDALSSSQQEILCSEFLRSESLEEYGLPRLAHLLVHVGRTMKDIDILGITTDFKRIFAQVTFKHVDQVKWKIERLRAYDSQDGDYFILFCDVDHPMKLQRVIVFPLRTVFEIFTNTAIGRVWLSHAIITHHQSRT